MKEKKKAEVNLEMGCGFFRIPTEEIIYNITVLPSNDSSATKVVEKIVEVEKVVEVEKEVSAPVVQAPPLVVDDYFQRSAQRIQQEIALAAEEADKTPTASGQLDPGVIQDLVAMTGDLKEVLAGMKNHPLLNENGSAGGGPANLTSRLEQLAGKIAQAQALPTASTEAAPSSPVPSSSGQRVTRYLFDLDTVFQTIYELCTNETVKGHIQNARAKADEIFNKEVFYDAISPKVGGYPEDDGFLTVPMTDIYTALGSACGDKAICNLLTKMDKQQSTIFLDQFLPLEVPPKEEVEVPGEEDSGAIGAAASGASDGGTLADLLNECRDELGSLIKQSAEQGGGQPLGGEDLVNQVDNALTIVATIHYDAIKLVEESAAGQGSATNPLWLKVKGLAAMAETMLSQKEARPELSFDDGLEAAQGAAQRYLSEITTQAEPTTETPPPPAECVTIQVQATEDFGEASQDDIDRLLEELA